MTPSTETPTEAPDGAPDADLTDADLDALAAAGNKSPQLPPSTTPPRTRPSLLWDLLKP